MRLPRWECLDYFDSCAGVFFHIRVQVKGTVNQEKIST